VDGRLEADDEQYIRERQDTRSSNAIICCITYTNNFLDDPVAEAVRCSDLSYAQWSKFEVERHSQRNATVWRKRNSDRSPPRGFEQNAGT